MNCEKSDENAITLSAFLAWKNKKYFLWFSLPKNPNWNNPNNMCISSFFLSLFKEMGNNNCRSCPYLLFFKLNNLFFLRSIRWVANPKGLVFLGICQLQISIINHRRGGGGFCNSSGNPRTYQILVYPREDISFLFTKNHPDRIFLRYLSVCHGEATLAPGCDWALVPRLALEVRVFLFCFPTKNILVGSQPKRSPYSLLGPVFPAKFP